MICTHKIKHYTNISLAENIFKEKILRIANDDPLNGDSVFNAKSYGEWLGNIFSAENTNCYIEFEWVGPCKDFFQNVTDKYPPDKWKDVEIASYIMKNMIQVHLDILLEDLLIKIVVLKLSVCVNCPQVLEIVKPEINGWGSL